MFWLKQFHSLFLLLLLLLLLLTLAESKWLHSSILSNIPLDIPSIFLLSISTYSRKGFQHNRNKRSMHQKLCRKNRKLI